MFFLNVYYFRISTDLSNWFWDESLLSQSLINKSTESSVIMSNNNNKAHLFSKIFSKHGSSFLNEADSNKLFTFCFDELRNITDCVCFLIFLQIFYCFFYYDNF